MSKPALPLTFGAATLGNLTEAITDEQSVALLDAVWESGIRSFDTAPHYGLGLSERRLGAYLSTKPREEFTISTKVGRLLRPNPTPTARDDDLFEVPGDLVRVWDFSLAGIRASLAESLERLGLSSIDTLYLHDPEKAPGMPIEAGLEALAQVRDDADVTSTGIGSMNVEALARAARHPEPDCLMVAGRFTLLDHSATTEVLPLCADNGIGVAATAIFNSGLLARPRPSGTYDYADASPEIVARANRIADICTAHGTDLPTAALHYVARSGTVRSIVFGARSPEQIRENVARANAAPPEDLWLELIAERLIPERVR